ncbi:WD40 repeat domain-containing protein [Flavobacteriaceae sp. LMIT009]
MRLNKVVFFWIFFVVKTSFSQIDVGRCYQELKKDFCYRVVQISQNYLLHSANNENTIYLVNKNNVKVFSSLNYGIITAALDEKEKKLAIAYYDKSIIVYDVETESVVWKKNYNTKVNVLTFNKGNLYFGLDSGQVFEHSFSLNQTKLITQHQSIVRGLVMQDERLLSVSHEGMLKINNLKRKVKEEQSVQFREVLTAITISPDKQKIIIGDLLGYIHVLNSQYRLEKKVKIHENLITKLDFKDNDNLYSSSFDKKLISTNLKINKSEILFKAKDYIMTFDYYDDKIIFTSREGVIKYYNLKCVD